MATIEGGLKTMAKVFRRECHRVLQSERTTIHGADGMLMVLQLALAEVNKQETGEFKVCLSDVLMAWKHLLLDKLHLPLCNIQRPENYDRIREAYESFLKRSNTKDLVDVHSLYKQLRVDPDPEEPLSPAQLFEFLSGSTEVSEPSNSPVPSTPSGRVRPCSLQVKRAVRRVFHSYLDLLVNSNNDMALAHVLNIPDRSLGQAAFTDLKHAARQSSTSLFLAATSFVRAIQLGGKGYAPAEADPLRKHIKGLSDFVQFLDNLEEVLGETPDPRVCGWKLVASIRSALLKGRSSGEEVYAATEETTKDLKEKISELHQRQTPGGVGISPARPKAYAINHATAYGGRETVKLLMALLDEEALTPPSRNKADLLYEEDQAVFRDAQGTSILTLFRSPEVSTGPSPEPLRNRVQSRREQLKPKTRERVIRSQFACTYQDDDLPLNRMLEFPSTSQVPTCVHPAPKRRVMADDEHSEPRDTAVVQDLGAAELHPESESEELRVPNPKAALGPKSGNAQRSRAGVGVGKKTGDQMAVKSRKRKQVDADHHGGSENQPPNKKAPASVPSKVAGANASKAQRNKKLIAGQGKLTSFFRV